MGGKENAAGDDGPKLESRPLESVSVGGSLLIVNQQLLIIDLYACPTKDIYMRVCMCRAAAFGLQCSGIGLGRGLGRVWSSAAASKSDAEPKKLRPSLMEF